MLKRAAIKPRRQNAPRPAEKVTHGYLKWLRGRECAAFGFNSPCEGKIEAAHVDHAGGKGMGTKTADRNAIPLCSYHHHCQHTIGWRTFERNLNGQDAVLLAEAYWRAWPGRIAYEKRLADDRG